MEQALQHFYYLKNQFLVRAKQARAITSAERKPLASNLLCCYNRSTACYKRTHVGDESNSRHAVELFEIFQKVHNIFFKTSKSIFSGSQMWIPR